MVVAILKGVNNPADANESFWKTSVAVTLFTEMEQNSSGWSTWHEIGKHKKKCLPTGGY